MTDPRFYSRRQLRELPAPEEAWLAPFWLRFFVAGLGVVASVSLAYMLTSLWFAATADVRPREAFPIVAGSALAAFLSVLALRFFNPLDWRKWFRFALCAEGIYLSGHRSGLVFVPWSAVEAIDIERWTFKGEHSAARLLLDLDDAIWNAFERGARIVGEGRRRRVTVNVAGKTGEELVERIDAYRTGLNGGQP